MIGTRCRHIELLDFAKDTVAAYPNGTSLGNSAHIDALIGKRILSRCSAGISSVSCEPC